MAEKSELVKQWFKRFEESQKLKETWETEFEVKRCAAYYLGHQREEPLAENGDKKVIINRILPAVRASIPSLVYNYPYARVVASPARSDTPGSRIEDRAKLLEDTVNSLIRDPKAQFQEQTYLAIKESFWSFGCVEVVYSADFTDNPAAKKPPIKEDEDTKVEAEKPEQEALLNPLEMLEEEEVPEKLVRDETFYVRRIPSKQILVGKNESAIVEECDWVGYYEWLPLQDVKRAPAYKNTRDLKPTNEKKEGEDGEGSGDMVKLFKIWDMRSKTRYVLADGHEQILLKEKFERLPLFFLRFEILPDKFFPVPPIYSSLPAQDEYNDSREMLRQLRKAIVPRYTYDENAVKPEDMEKLEGGEIGAYIPTNASNPTPIQPISQPSLNDNTVRTLALSSQEFTELFGVSGESRQIPQSDTATQASIINQKEQIQNSFDRQIVGRWLGAISKEMLLQAIEFMVLPKWVRINSDPFSPGFMQDAQNIAQMYQEITMEDLLAADGDLRWDVTVDMDTLSPMSEKEKAAAWNQALSMISNPSIARILAMSPEILVQTLKLNGIKDAKQQEAIGKALSQLAAMEMAQTMAAAAGGQGPAPKGVSPMGATPPAQGGTPPAAPGPRPVGPSGGM